MDISSNRGHSVYTSMKKQLLRVFTWPLHLALPIKFYHKTLNSVHCIYSNQQTATCTAALSSMLELDLRTLLDLANKI